MYRNICTGILMLWKCRLSFKTCFLMHFNKVDLSRILIFLPKVSSLHYLGRWGWLLVQVTLALSQHHSRKKQSLYNYNHHTKLSCALPFLYFHVIRLFHALAIQERQFFRCTVHLKLNLPLGEVCY